MVMRLGFSLGISTRPDVYFIDEILAVGDQHFQRRCHEALGRYMRAGGTLLVCAHEMFHIRKLCNRVIWIDGGKARMIGDPFEVTKAYEEHERRKQREETTKTAALSTGKDLSQLPQLASIKLCRPGSSDPVESFRSGETLDVVVEYEAPDESIPFSVGIRIDHLDNFLVTGSSVMHEGFNLRGSGRATLRWHDLQLLPSDYMLSVYIVDNTGTIAYSEEMGIVRFSIQAATTLTNGAEGIYQQEGKWVQGNGELIVGPSSD
jgi:lipopolysaccharide transport system ATP-binding protein